MATVSIVDVVPVGTDQRRPSPTAPGPRRPARTGRRSCPRARSGRRCRRCTDDLAEVVLAGVSVVRRVVVGDLSGDARVVVRAQHVVADLPADALGGLRGVLGAGRERRARDASPTSTGSSSDAVHGEGHRRRRSDRVGPVGAGDADPEPLAGRPRVGAGVEVDHHVVRLARARAAPAAPWTPSRKARSSGAARRPARRCRRRRRRRASPTARPAAGRRETRSRATRLPDDGAGGRVDVPGQRAGVVEPLVARQPPGQVPGAVDPGGGADVRVDHERRAARRGRACADAVGRHRGQRAATSPRAGRGRARAGSRCARTRRSRPRASPGAAQPAVEPGGQLGVEVDPRPGHRGGRVGVRPRPGEQPVRDARLRRARRRCGRSCCGSRPPSPRRSSPGTRSARSPRVVPSEPHRPVVPVGAVPVLAQPGQHPRLVGRRAAAATRPPSPSPQTAGTGGSTHIGVM